ncbi:tripartite motif-containing protein 52 [Patagioenas fasciata monilis]|uniref:Tripartite motif-containing protein 52 n=1 Tax=Patagioenas fasciata monilis TaxID=372326 RepID=A0A1V4K6G4_PATFA|nr:tripartite motif-containing protein 52 [Patagioenas fasciata monilis]
MAAVFLPGSLQDEATCSVCLEFFKDPVSIECGHNFCRSCIAKSWKDLEADFPCPQCREVFQQQSFRPNRQLANMAEIIGHFALRGAKGAEDEGLCPKHREALKLFCKDDRRSICVVCDRSRDHRPHAVVPVDEAAEEYKVSDDVRCQKPVPVCTDMKMHVCNFSLKTVVLEKVLKKFRENLRDELGRGEKAGSGTIVSTQRRPTQRRPTQPNNGQPNNNQPNNGQPNVQANTDEHNGQPNNDELNDQPNNDELNDQPNNVQPNVQPNNAQLKVQPIKVQPNIQPNNVQPNNDQPNVQPNIQPNNVQHNKDIKGTFIRCENIKFQEPEMVPVDVGKKYGNCFLQDVVMRKMEKVFSKVPKAEVTLDPASAHPRLALSLDRRGLKLAERRPDGADPAAKRSDGDFSVLGLPGFTGGRHYWEVEIAGRRGWAVGAAARRRDRARPHSNREVWCVGTNGRRYQACGGAEQTPLAPGERPRRFRVYLDYERGQLGFYNADTMGHIHTFRAAFRERVCPFFRVLGRGTRIRICA